MPALAVAGALKETGVECVLVGAARGLEADILPGRGFRYHLLPSEPIYRRQVWKNARWILLGPRLMRQALQLIDLEKPDLVLGTGGYAAAAPLFAARRRGVPIVLQEQNAYPGITTRRFARHARAVFLGFPEAARFLRCPPAVEVIHTGNPVVPPHPDADRSTVRSKLGLPEDARVVFVMGGSQGSLAINRAVSEWLDGGLRTGGGGEGEVNILWSTGARTVEMFRRHHAPPAVDVRAFWDPVADAYTAADLVVCRAGAMTTAELSVFGKPAILVPLPAAAAGHQRANALAMAKVGAALHLPEAELSGPRLAAEVRRLAGDDRLLARMSERALARGKPQATQDLVNRLSSLIRKV